MWHIFSPFPCHTLSPSPPSRQSTRLASWGLPCVNRAKVPSLAPLLRSCSAVLVPSLFFAFSRSSKFNAPLSSPDKTNLILPSSPFFLGPPAAAGRPFSSLKRSLVKTQGSPPNPSHEGSVRPRYSASPLSLLLHTFLTKSPL